MAQTKDRLRIIEGDKALSKPFAFRKHVEQYIKQYIQNRRIDGKVVLFNTLTQKPTTEEEIRKACVSAAAEEFINKMPKKYETIVGENGVRLSGGQKQRSEIARTLLSNPKLLILDEATSALDYETERKVCEGIRKSSQGSTVFFITHRLSTVRNSDLIVMLHDGYIAEKGTHQELMDLKGRYFALYRQQESS